MNLELKDFQKEAVASLLADLLSAKREIERPGRARPQALLLSAPTASGLTVIMAALREDSRRRWRRVRRVAIRTRTGCCFPLALRLCGQVSRLGSAYDGLDDVGDRKARGSRLLN
jgi:hypothetical protein